jgi:glycopeptide antibiotics resistance protein
MTGPFTQFIPFNFIGDFIKETSLNIHDVHTYIGALKEHVVIQPVFNIFLTLPFGIYLSYYFKQSLKKTLLITFLLSVFFELTQLSGLYGLYEHPYRLFDVDDLMLNTLGGFIGFFIYKHFLLFLPSKEKIDEANLKKSEKVGYIRRIFAFIIDSIAALLIQFLINIVFNLQEISALSNIILLLYLFVSQILFKQTIGKFLVHIKIESDKGENYHLAIIKRYAILIILFIPFVLLNILDLITKSVYLNSTYVILELMILLFFSLDFLYSFTKEKRLFYERFSSTKIVSTIKFKEQSEH